jgi:hypothetical protein
VAKSLLLKDSLKYKNFVAGCNHEQGKGPEPEPESEPEPEPEPDHAINLIT